MPILFLATMPTCTLSSSPSLQPQLGPEPFKISNNMVHASNPNNRYNVKLAEKIQPNGYALFVVSHTYDHGYTLDFVVHMVYKIYFVYRQEINSMNIFTIITLTNLIN